MDWDIVSALVKAVELKDDSTAAHTWRVALYTQALAEAAGATHRRVEGLMKAAALHDVGKIDIPGEILAKPGRLEAAEYEVIKSHAVLGYERLARMGEADASVLGLVRSHHERLDGSGYPDGLKGDQIPLEAKWFAVIDTFDAMTSLRPYRRDVGPAAAIAAFEELEAQSGRWYCAEAVELMRRLYRGGALDFILRYFNDDETRGLALPTAEEIGKRVERAGG
jgi:putative two-component system response regulator